MSYSVVTAQQACSIEMVNMFKNTVDEYLARADYAYNSIYGLWMSQSLSVDIEGDPRMAVLSNRFKEPAQASQRLPFLLTSSGSEWL